jgi:predicted TIM-barrel fold metal-dependent hydrolase
MTAKRLEGRDEPILDPDIPIIDAHHHLFDRHELRYLLDEYLSDAKAGHNIVASVYVETVAFARPSGPEVLRPLGEIEFANGIGAMAASGRYGDCHVCAGIVGFADMRSGDDVAKLLDASIAAAPDRFRGVRQVSIEHPSEAPFTYMMNRPKPGVMSSPGFPKAMKHLADRGLSFDACVFHHQLGDIAVLADQFPHTTIVLDHLGFPIGLDLDVEGKKRVFEEWRMLVADVAKRQNVVCKLGGLGMPWCGFALERRTDPIGYMELADIYRPFIDVAVQVFGVSRCMFESNVPPDGRSYGFVPYWNAMKQITRDYSGDEKAALFHRTAAETYNLKIPSLENSSQQPNLNVA